MIELKTGHGGEWVFLLSSEEFEKYNLQGFKMDVNSYFDADGEPLICVRFNKDSELKSFKRSKLIDKMLE